MKHAGNRTEGESSFQKTVNILLPFLIYFVVHDLAQLLLVFLLNASFGMFGETYTQAVKTNAASINGILNALALLIGMAAILPMAVKEMRGKAVDTLWVPGQSRGKSKGQKLLAYGLLVCFGVTLAVGMNLLLTISGLTQASHQYAEVANRQFGVAFGLGIVLYGVVSPLAEEMVFRGLIYNRMKRYFKVPLAIVVCGILFGIYHGNLVQGIYGSVLGIAITLMYEWYGSFMAPVLFHGAANVSVFILSYQAQTFQGLVTPMNIIVCMLLASISFLGIVAVTRK